MSIPLSMTKAGAQPAQPATLRAQLVAAVAASNPGYTANLPGSLIEDIASTDVGALVLIDSAQIDLVNSLTPFGTNEFLLTDLGSIYGVPQGVQTNTSVYLVFSGTVGFPIQVGFTVSDGTHQYVVQDGGIVGTGGTTTPLFAVATVTGAWPVPAGSVNQLVTSVPSTVQLTVTNPLDGTPSTSAESLDTYRSRVLQAGLVASQGMLRYLKTALFNVPGVQPRLVSVQQNGDSWEIIVGGTADPYQIANAIFEAVFDIGDLVGSTTNVINITNTFPAVVTTDINHGLTTGQTIFLNGVQGMTSLNGVPLVATILDPTNFSIGIDTTSYPAYTGGGVVTPNYRNQVISIYDYPDVYEIPFVIPPQQTVRIDVVWNTSAINVISESAVASAGSTALASYVNSVPVGQPINLFELQSVFQASIADIVPPQLLTRMVFTVTINGIATPPEAGTGIIAGDRESYFQTSSSQISVLRG